MRTEEVSTRRASVGSRRDRARWSCPPVETSTRYRRRATTGERVSRSAQSGLLTVGGAWVGCRRNCFRSCLTGRGAARSCSGEVAAMRFLLGFLFGTYCNGNRLLRITFLLMVLFMTFCLYQMSKPLGHNRRIASRATETHGLTQVLDRLTLIRPSITTLIASHRSSSESVQVRLAARPGPILRRQSFAKATGFR